MISCTSRLASMEEALQRNGQVKYRAIASQRSSAKQIHDKLHDRKQFSCRVACATKVVDRKDGYRKGASTT